MGQDSQQRFAHQRYKWFKLRFHYCYILFCTGKYFSSFQDSSFVKLKEGFLLSGCLSGASGESPGTGTVRRLSVNYLDGGNLLTNINIKHMVVA